MPILLFTEDCLVDEGLAVLTFIGLFSMAVICAWPSFLEVAPCFQCPGKSPDQRQYQKSCVLPTLTSSIARRQFA
jgi:hypothetical protein